MINSISSNTQELLKQAQDGNSNAINQLCQGIYNATAGKWGTDENYINTIMQNADSKILASIMDVYSDVTGSEIYKDIENDFSGKAEKEILATLENAYKEVNNEEYADDNDGKLSIDQKAQSVGNGLLNKAPDIALTVGGVALAKSAIGACISGAATTALTAVFGTAATTVATIAAPVLAGVGLVAAGVMIYKGVTQTAQAIKDGQNATTDDVAQNALQQGTEGVITTGLGIYEGYESIKAIGDITKANEINKQCQQESDAGIAAPQPKINEHDAKIKTEAEKIIEKFNDEQMSEFCEILNNCEEINFENEIIRHATTSDNAVGIIDNGYSTSHSAKNNGSNNFGGMDVEMESLIDFGNRYGDTKLEYTYTGKALKLDNRTSETFKAAIINSEVDGDTLMFKLWEYEDGGEILNAIARNLLKKLGYDAIIVAPKGESFFMTILEPSFTDGLKFIKKIS